jgi:thioredoxin 1
MTDWTDSPPTREQLDVTPGPMLLEFGTPWCGHCRAAQPLIDAVIAERPELAYLRIEDGPGRRLGRAYGVKLWPTLVFLRDGKELAREVRPRDVSLVRAAAQKVLGDAGLQSRTR